MQSRGSAYLIGNGYSLTPERLDTLKDEVTFAMNGIASIFSKTDWRPTYYVMVTTRYRSDTNFRALVEEAVRSAQVSFIDYEYREKNFFKRPDIEFVKTYERLEWNTGVEEVSKFATSMFTALQIASALGFCPLYLYGVDGYRTNGANHFDGDYYNGNYELEEENINMRLAYEYAEKHCPYKIIDLTESEGFGVFSRV
jgi:hypothetical protein